MLIVWGDVCVDVCMLVNVCVCRSTRVLLLSSASHDLSSIFGCPLCQQVQAVVDATLARFGHVDILVSNAGFQHIDAIENFPFKIWKKMVYASSVELCA
jgi:NAD(P)-dependent dehydrogenase (short-subunit alcohol dehydrogenase family)